MAKILWQDILVFAAIILNIAAKLTTGIIENTLAAVVQTANVLEANPVQRSVATGSYFIQFVTSSIMYAMLLSLYWWFRKGHNQNEYSKYAFAFFTILVFWSFFSDFLNDASVLIGIIIK